MFSTYSSLQHLSGSRTRLSSRHKLKKALDPSLFDAELSTSPNVNSSPPKLTPPKLPSIPHPALISNIPSSTTSIQQNHPEDEHLPENLFPPPDFSKRKSVLVPPVNFKSPDRGMRSTLAVNTNRSKLSENMNSNKSLVVPTNFNKWGDNSPSPITSPVSKVSSIQPSGNLDDDDFEELLPASSELYIQSEYTLLGYEQMMGLLSILFVKSVYLPYISGLSISTYGTGFLVYFINLLFN
jgi:hypothetical protein